MRATLIIARREVQSFFSSPVAYVVLTAWVLYGGLSYYILAEYFASSPSAGGSDNPLTSFFGETMLFYLMLLAFGAVLTMRLIAEETRTGSLELLLTAPVSSTAVVMGKYLAALVFWGSLWVPTFLYVWITSRYGSVDLGAVGASYFGVMVIGAQYMAIGLLMSTLAPNQMIAAVLTLLVLIGLFVLGIGEFVFQDATRQVLGFINVFAHMREFARGVVDTRRLVYYGSVAAFALFLAQRRLEARRVS